MVDRDLPEPKHRAYSSVEIIDRQWRVIWTFLLLLTGYSFLHKVMIPGILKLTALKGSPYAKIDPWVIHSLLLAIALRHKTVTRWGAFLAGGMIVYGIHELWRVSLGGYPGWLAFSRLLASLPLAVGSGVVLALYCSQARVYFAWSGAVCIAVILFSSGYLSKRMEIEVAAPVANLSERQNPSVSVVAPSCGAMSVELRDGTLARNDITLSACGLSPSTIVAQDFVRVENLSDSPVNLHFLISDGKRNQNGWNILVPARSQRQSPKISLKSSEVGILYSDTNPQAGLVGVRSAVTSDRWILTRQPLKAARGEP